MPAQISQLAIEISPPSEGGVRMAILKIDGREFLEIVQEVEIPLAAETGEANLAGTYDYLNIRSVLGDAQHLFGQPQSSMLRYGTKVSILECECGCEGCWPLILDSEVTPTHVIWKNFEQVHREWEYPAHFKFVFARTAYEQAIVAARGRV